MPKATKDATSTSRRSIIGAGIAAALACGGASAAVHVGVAAPGPHPDADLLMLCAEYHRQFALIAVTDAHDEAAHEALTEDRWEVVERIEKIVPLTDEGRKAKAALAVAVIHECHYGDLYAHEWFVYRTLCDLAGSVPA
jgi:hypothetical protein